MVQIIINENQLNLIKGELTKQSEISLAEEKFNSQFGKNNTTSLNTKITTDSDPFAKFLKGILTGL